MADYHSYEHVSGQQYFNINTYLYAHQPDGSDPDTQGPWVSRYKGPLKLELKATSHMSLQEVILLNLPDIKLELCATFTALQQFRTSHNRSAASKKVVPLDELAIRLRDNYLTLQISKPLVSDARHKLLVSLLERESRTMGELQTIYTLLESIEVMEQDFKIFTPLRNLIELISSFSSDLRNKVQVQWDPLQVYIGDLFLSFRSLWAQHYNTYFRRYKDMTGFVDVKRRNTFTLPGNSERDRNAVYRLEAIYRRLDEILSMPFDQVDYCENILNSILNKHTPANHPDRAKLFGAHQLIKETLQIAKNEKQACENERALKLVQDKFQSEILLLYSKNPLETFQAFKKILPVSGVATKSRLRPQPSRPRQDSQASDSSRATSNNSEMFAPPPRTLIKEGSFQMVHVQSPQHTHERYLVLLTDLLILAKPSHAHKTTPLAANQLSSSLTLKQIIPLQFVWTSDQLDANLESHKADAFLIGWPAENSGVNNFAAIFSTSEERRQWYDTINNTIDKARQELTPVRVSVQIGTEPPKILTKEVSHTTRTNQLQESTFVSLVQHSNRPYLMREHFTFLVVVKETQYTLSGFECPAAIKSYFSHVLSWRKGQQIDTTDTGCHFLMKQTGEMESQGGIRKRIMSGLHFSKKARYQHPFQDTICETANTLFHMPLDTIMPPPNYNIPNVLKCILLKLFRLGPEQQGIFRVEASSKDVNELRRKIELGDKIDFEEWRTVVVANLFKRFLRAIPGCLLPSSKYTELAATNDIKVESERVERIKKILLKIPLSNYKLSHHVFAMMSQVAQNVAHNQMTATNIGIAVGPAILQPMEGLMVYQLEMNEITSFIVQHCEDIFGRQLPELYTKTASPTHQLVPINDENNSKRQLYRGDSNDSMEFDQRAFDSTESDSVTTPTNEPALSRGGKGDSRRDSRSRFKSEPNFQRRDKKRGQEIQVLKKNISIEVTESPNSQSKSTPNSPELARNLTKLEAPNSDTHSHSTPNTPEAPRGNKCVTNDTYMSSEEEDGPTSYVSPHYYKHKATNQLSSPLTHNNYPMTSPNYQSPHYYHNIPKQHPSNTYFSHVSPRATGTSRSFPHRLNQENNVRQKPNSLPRSKACYELTYPPNYTDTFTGVQLPRRSQKSRSFESHESSQNVLPLSIQKTKAIIASFPIIQDAQLVKVSEVRPMADVSCV